MKKTLLALLIASSAHAAPVTLDGEHTTAADIAAIARGETVAIADSAQARVEKSFAVLLAAAKTGQPIYGFTVGVGWNKDRTFINAKGELDQALIKASQDFNRGLIRAHVGAGRHPARRKSACGACHPSQHGADRFARPAARLRPDLRGHA